MKYSRTVLHVDDDPSILKLVDKTLEVRDLKVISLSDPSRALATLIESNVRVVILDIDMPYKDGLTLLAEIKEHDAAIQVIMCTALVSVSTVLQASSLGAESCIFKPILDVNKVIEAVDRAFAKIDRWWEALEEWKLRKKTAYGSDSPLNVG